MLVVQRVAAAVVSLEQHRAPREAERHTGWQAAASFDVRERQPDVLADAPGVVPRRQPALGCDLGPLSFELHPARRDADLVVAEHIDVDAVAAPRSLPVTVFERGRHDRFERPVERDGNRVVRFASEANTPIWLDDVVADRPRTDEVGIVAEAAAAADRPLLSSARDPRVAIEHVAVDVLADAEADLQRTVARRGHRA